ncbi:MAG: OmpA family protein [Thermoanaerobaculia bacterium]
MLKRIVTFMLVASMALPVAFAQDVSQTRDKTRKGAVIGAVAGGVLGAVIGNNRGSGNAKKGGLIGAAAGAAIGAGVGAYMDKQERELRKIPGVDVTRTADDELNVTVNNEVLFDFDSSALRSASRQSLEEMANVFQRYPDTTISVQGHTDSIGSASYNYRLSQRRANSVERYLEQLGVSGGRLDTEAFGESQPVASNATAAGRQQNRRVEIHVRANQA